MEDIVSNILILIISITMAFAFMSSMIKPCTCCHDEGQKYGCPICEKEI